MVLIEAKRIAADLLDAMRPFCDRVQVAGSIRRGKADVKDIEIVAIPKYEEIPAGLFGEPDRVNMLYRWAIDTASAAGVIWIKPNVADIVPWQPKVDGKQWKGYLPEHGIKLDLFLCTPRNWGAIFLIRTGSADFSAAVMTHAKTIGTPCQDGYFRTDAMRGHFRDDESSIETREEQDVFDLLGLEYVEPRLRRDMRVVRQVRP